MTLDVEERYYKVQIAKGKEQKTAFQTKEGLFKICVMLFILMNALVTF